MWAIDQPICKFNKKQNKITYQSHAAQNGEAVDNVQAEIDERGQDDHKVENVSAVAEEIRARGPHFQDAICREDRSENL